PGRTRRLMRRWSCSTMLFKYLIWRSREKGHSSPLRFMAVTAPAPALPDDPGLLKTMLLEERAESERLRQIIKALQRHRFGRRAESLSDSCRTVPVGPHCPHLPG